MGITWKGLEGFSKVESITKGWSEDKKYCVTAEDGTRMFLRISDISGIENKRAEYRRMERLYDSGVPVPQPLAFGTFDAGKICYSLSAWIDGADAEEAMPLMSAAEQYDLGLKAGKILRLVHRLAAPADSADWEQRYFAVIEERIEAYRASGITFKDSEIVLEYLERNRALLHDRPQCFLHGDYHEGNLLVGTDSEIYVIDLLDEGFGNYGDPWYDFKTFGENDNACFSTGLVRGYFGGEPPLLFWETLTCYIVTAALTSIVWVKYHNPAELPETLRWNEENARCLKEGRSPLMKWYLKDFYIQYSDGVPFKLKAPFDFSFLSKYGRVFKVYDNQDSGNICFGVTDGRRKYFIKFAGAPTDRACISSGEAVANLKRTVPVYRDLAHPNLITLVASEEIGGGFAMIFEWADAECMHPMYPRSRETFLKMTRETRHQVFEDILTFHIHAAKKGYVAIDFYDGSIMYDFGNHKTIICDVDFYAKAPYRNQMGRLWGSSRFMSPEEYQLGAAIDEITNVYAMGAAAFALFGNDRDKGMEGWTESKELFLVAQKAVSKERDKRQQSIEQLLEEWREARGKIRGRGVK